MAKLLKGKIDVTKIIKYKLFKVEKGTYLHIDIWINDAPDQYGNIASIAQSSAQGEAKNYIGSAKEWSKKDGETSKPTTASDGLPF